VKAPAIPAACVVATITVSCEFGSAIGLPVFCPSVRLRQTWFEGDSEGGNLNIIGSFRGMFIVEKLMLDG